MIPAEIRLFRCHLKSSISVGEMHCDLSLIVWCKSGVMIQSLCQSHIWLINREHILLSDNSWHNILIHSSEMGKLTKLWINLCWCVQSSLFSRKHLSNDWMFLCVPLSTNTFCWHLPLKTTSGNWSPYKVSITNTSSFRCFSLLLCKQHAGHFWMKQWDVQGHSLNFLFRQFYGDLFTRMRGQTQFSVMSLNPESVKNLWIDCVFNKESKTLACVPVITGTCCGSCASGQTRASIYIVFSKSVREAGKDAQCTCLLDLKKIKNKNIQIQMPPMSPFLFPRTLIFHESPSASLFLL